MIGYCFSFDFYQGKWRGDDPVEEPSAEEVQVAAAHSEEPVSRLDDTMTGPAALLRNCAWMHGTHRTVFCDRFCTSVGLFLKLKQMGINAVGTIMSNRKGFSHLVKFTSHEERTCERGSLKMAKSLITGTTDHILAIGWLDTKPVYMIATGVASAGEHVVRRLRQGAHKILTACRALKLYHKYMGGVDTHDYMRMGAYSLQKSYHVNYWPKTMFLAILDLVLVNIYILWKFFHDGTPQMMTREDFYLLLAEEMFFYTGFEDVVRTRSKPVRPPSPAVVTPRSKKGGYTRELNPQGFPGHERVPYQTMPKQTRHNSKMIKEDDYKWGRGGRNNTYRHCYVCQRIGANAMIQIYTAVAAVSLSVHQSHCGLTKRMKHLSAGTSFIWIRSSNARSLQSTCRTIC